MTTLQTILSIITASLAILTSVIVFIKWSSAKANKKLNEKIDKKINDFKDEVFEKLDNICETMNNIGNQLNEQEKWRLRDNILMFAQILRNTTNIENVSENIFNNIFQDYDKYKELGGNSFVDSEMEYIKKMHKQKDNFKITNSHKGKKQGGKNYES